MEKARLCEFMYVCVCVFTATTDQIKKAVRTLKQTSLFSLHTPGLLFFPWFLFSPSNYSDVITQISSLEHSTQKIFSGPGVETNAIETWQDAVPGRRRKHTGFGESPLSPAATGSPKQVIFFYLAFVDHNLTAA